MNHVTHPWVLLTSEIFHLKSANFVMSRNTDIDCILIHNFQFLNFSWVFQDFLINLVTIMMMSAKMATPSLLKTTVFWNKGYHATFPVDDITNKILSRDSNYIVDVFMWPKFGNSSISMREIITTSIL